MMNIIKHDHGFVEYRKGSHVIYNGDAISVIEIAIKDKSVDLIFADPPYNIGKDFNGRIDK
jgi:adenine-specific DNA-methyltransferase